MNLRSLPLLLTAAVLAHASLPIAIAQNSPPTTPPAAPPKPEPKNEFTRIAERLTKVKVSDAKIDAGLVDRSGKALVEITVDPKTFPTHTIASGDRLFLIARKHYGNGHYGEFLAAYNGIDPGRLKVGQVVSIPTIDAAFNAAGLYPIMKSECDAILKTRSEFMEIEPSLRDRNGKAIDDVTKEKLLKWRKEILETMRAFGAGKPGIKSVPSSTQVQLRSCAESLNRLAKGKFTSQQVDRVHQRLGFATGYAIIWARNGY